MPMPKDIEIPATPLSGSRTGSESLVGLRWLLASPCWRTRKTRPPLAAAAGANATMSGETWKPDRTHHEPRYRYTCYLRRVSGKCDAPYVSQDALELDIRRILEAVALPTGFAEAVDAALAAYMGKEGRKSRKETLRSLEERQSRLNEMFELGSIPATEYQAKCAALDNQRTNLKTKRAEPVLVRQRTMLATLVEDWDEMTPEERRRVVGVVFAEIHASSDGIARLLPREDWKLYIRAVLREPATLARVGYGAEDGTRTRDKYPQREHEPGRPNSDQSRVAQRQEQRERARARGVFLGQDYPGGAES